MECGADPNAIGYDYATILHMKCGYLYDPYYSEIHADLYAVKLLLDYGADPNSLNTAKFKRPPLFYAVYYHPEIAFYLIQRGADINLFPGGKEHLLKYLRELPPKKQIRKDLFDLVSSK